MYKSTIALIAATLVSASALAATETDRMGVTTSDDPAKVSAVEQHAQELQRQHSVNSSGTQSSAKATKQKHAKSQKHVAKHTTKKTSRTTTTTTTTNQ